MCGIIGFNFEDRILARKMCDIITHRGPDGEGFYTDTNITLGHRRLSVIDLKTGDQPIYNEDGSIAIVYNGEIYNYKEIRESLEKKGHRFSTNTDTEVIVHSYEEYGHECVNLFNGMFAFALYDSNTRELFIARDRFGIKPLHYTILDDGKIIFASEIKSILQYKPVIRKMNPQSLHSIINLRYIPGEDTMFEGIKRLLPGHIMIIRGNDISIKRYWKTDKKISTYSEDYYIKKTRKLLEESVKRHLISDVPVGVLLSGGIDSSSIVALASKFSDDPVQTFCMGFGRDDDENLDAKKTADYFGTEHKDLIISDNLLKDYPKMIWYADEPKRNLYPYYIAELLAGEVKVVLGGLGADELFGGYIFKYNYVNKIENLRKRMLFERKKEYSAYAEKILSFQTRYGDVVDDENLDYIEMIQNLESNVDQYMICQTQDKVFDGRYLEQIYGGRLIQSKLLPIRDSYKQFFNNENMFIDQVLSADFNEKLVNDFLLVDDRTSMAHSVESRVPFLDYNLVNFSMNIPSDILLKDKEGKYILKQAMKDILPKEVLNKKKQGFASGMYEVYINHGREIMQQILPEGNLVREDYIDKEYINKILNAVPNPKLGLHYGVMLNLLTAEIWYRIFIEGDLHKPAFNEIFTNNN